MQKTCLLQSNLRLKTLSKNYCASKSQKKSWKRAKIMTNIHVIFSWYISSSTDGSSVFMTYLRLEILCKDWSAHICYIFQRHLLFWTIPIMSPFTSVLRNFTQSHNFILQSITLPLYNYLGQAESISITMIWNMRMHSTSIKSEHSLTNDWAVSL